MANSLIAFIKKHKAVITVAALAFVIRLVYLLELSSAPGFANPMIDEKWHWEWANEILSGPFFGDGAWFRAPLYPYFLAFLSLITGGSVFWSKLLQLFLTAGTAVFTFRIAEALLNRRTAIIAGIMYALYGTFLYYETMFLIPVLFVFLLTWGMYRLVAGGYTETKSLLFTGFIFGLAAIARPNILLVVPALMFWMWFAHRRLTSSRTALTKAVLLAVGVGLAVLPVTMRNVIVTGEMILISSQGGVNLYLGNNPQANGLNMIMPEVILDEAVTWREFVPATTRAAEKEAGRDLSDAEVSSFWTGKAIDFVTEHPGDFLALVGKKMAYLAMGFENSDNLDVYHQRNQSLLYAMLLWKVENVFYFPFGLLLPLFLLGVVLLKEKRHKLLPLYVFIIIYIPTIVLFLVTARHRLPLIPFFIIIAAGGLAYVTSNWSKMKGSLKATAIIFPLLLVYAFNQTFFAAGDTNEFQNYYNDGLRYANQGDYSNAEIAFSKAYEYNPNSVPLLDNLAFAQFQVGNLATATQNFQRAIELNPYYGRAYNNLGLVLLKEGEPDSAITLFERSIQEFADEAIGEPVLSQIYLNLGDAYEAMNDTSRAAFSHQRAMEVAPENAKAYFEASAYFARMEQYDHADTAFERGMLFGEARPADHFNWGLSLLRRQMLEKGAKEMKAVLEKDPKFYQAAFCLAAAYRDLGAPVDSSLKYIHLSLQLNPQYQPAVRLLNSLNQGQP